MPSKLKFEIERLGEECTRYHVAFDLRSTVRALKELEGVERVDIYDRRYMVHVERGRCFKWEDIDGRVLDVLESSSREVETNEARM